MLKAKFKLSLRLFVNLSDKYKTYDNTQSLLEAALSIFF